MERKGDKHRRSIRLKGYDYRNGGTYFVTICTKNRDRIFGEIRNGIVGLSEVGCIVADELQKTPIIRPYVTLDQWIIMPNHVHVIFQIDHHVDVTDTFDDTVGAPRRGRPYKLASTIIGFDD
ncbi:MAG TPA: hypothetical protein VHA78_04260 [Candidatus Peribacteraceae bacterium]|nr:hypothetical protein [Candidatus Peribacteraceae bacterium]